MCPLAICMSLGKCLFSFSARFCWVVGFFDFESYEQFIYFGHIICKCFYHSMCCLFKLLISFAVLKFIGLMRSHLLIFAFIYFAWETDL